MTAVEWGGPAEAGMPQAGPDVQQALPEEVVRDMLLNTRQAALLPDGMFEQVKRIAGNGDSDVRRAYALALAQYIADDHYRCKRPMYYEYFQGRYGDEAGVVACATEVPFRIASGLEAGATVWLNPERVKSVHMLFAGKGEAMMSRFGHLSLRLIVCPEDDLSEEACNSNLYEHLVLGYRAHVDEFKIDALSGLIGGYRSYLFASPFMDTYQEYAIGEFRELYSLPLNLSNQDRVQLVRALSEVHWGYAGEYRFLTNNCSSIAQKLLLHVWSDMAQEPGLRAIYWRPDAFFDALKHSPVADGGRIENLDRAEQEGFYFSSTLPFYKEAFELVQQAMTEASFAELEEYLAIHPGRRIRTLEEDEAYLTALTANPRLLSAQILLEELSLVKSERYLMGELAYYFDQHDLPRLSKQLRRQLSAEEYQVYSHCIAGPILQLIQPIRREDGIPETVAAIAGAEYQKACESATGRGHLKQVHKALKNIDPAGWQPIEHAMHYWVGGLNNIEFLTQMEARQAVLAPASD